MSQAAPIMETGSDLLGSMQERGPRRMHCSATPPIRSASGSRSAAAPTRRWWRRAARDPRARLVRHLCRGDTPVAQLCGADACARPVRRDRGAAGADRRRRVPGADGRRHPDEPRRAGAPRRSRPGRQGGRGAFHPGGRRPHRQWQHGGKSRPPDRTDGEPQRRHGRRLRPRRHARHHARGDAQDSPTAK